MRKKMLLFGTLAVLAAGGIFWGCQKEELAVTNPEGLNLKSAVNGVCVPDEYTLYAGQTANVGKLVVWNDEQNLYVEYVFTTTDPIGTLHLWVGTDATQVPAANGNPIPGQFTYTDSDGTDGYVFTIPLVDVFGTDVSPDAYCGEGLAIFAHAEVDGETAWSYGTPFTGKKWGWYSEYVVCCQNPPGNSECEWFSESSWAAGTRYVTKGNWATYTPYAAGTTVNLYAGQTMLSGTATFSAVVDGKVTITIKINDGWRFNNVLENIKIQGYSSTPAKTNPNPGSFANKYYASGTEVECVVPAAKIYGIHIDSEWEKCN